MTLLKEKTMLVHPVVIPGSGTRSWTVLGDDDVPVVPVDRFLAYLTDVGRSPNTVKAYSHDLRDYWEFLGFRGLDWREARLEDVGEFVAWLQLPPLGRAGEVAVLASVTAHVGASTVNRKLAAVSAFYAHQARNGADVGDLLVVWRTGGRGGWKPFLHHIGKNQPSSRMSPRTSSGLHGSPPRASTACMRRYPYSSLLASKSALTFIFSSSRLFDAALCGRDLQS
jgi:integrase/recombinase XerD